MTFIELETYAQENGFDSLKFKFINFKGEQKYCQWFDAYMGTFIIFQDENCNMDDEHHFVTSTGWINVGGDQFNYELFNKKQKNKMEKMTLAQGLVEKNQLVTQIKKLEQRLKTNFSVVGKNPDYNFSETLKKYNDTVYQLCFLKQRIAIGNTPVVEKIAVMGELKSLNKILSGLNHQNPGTRYIGTGHETVEPTNAMPIAQRDEIIEANEKAIQLLQTELNKYNNETYI